MKCYNYVQYLFIKIGIYCYVNYVRLVDILFFKFLENIIVFIQILLLRVKYMVMRENYIISNKIISFKVFRLLICNEKGRIMGENKINK